jgi:hypothetical protein
LVGSSVACFLSYPLVKGFFGGDHLETLVHGGVIAASIGLVGFGLVGLALGADHPLGRFPVAIALAIGTVVLGGPYILRIQEAAAPSCSLMDARPVTNASSPFAASCFRGFEDPWLQALLWFNVGFLALLFLVAAWRELRSSRKHERDGGSLGWLLAPFARGGSPFL